MRKLLALFFLLVSAVSFSQVPPRPDPPKLYNNLSQEFPDFLSAADAETIEEKLENFSKETSNQIAVVIVDDLGGTDPASFATAIGTEWGIGKKESNNGIVILLKPNTHDLFIAIGYGLEGAIPDLATKRIREEQMNPYLKDGDNFGAINNGVDVLMGLAKGEINVKDYAKENNNDDNWLKIAIAIFVIIMFLKIVFGKGGGTGFGGSGRYYGGGFSGGSWSSGGGGGGGFGGFGGGSFGGGGSGGKW